MRLGLPRPAWVSLYLVLLAIAAGCASPESSNQADRPWNTPKNWEHGLPPGMMEGR